MHVGDLQALSVSESSAQGLVKAFLRPRPGYVPKVLPKMDKVLRQELQIPLRQSVFWTDSTTVLNYIGNESARFKTFVANRVSQIRDATTPLQWRFVKSSQNPSDQATRGLKAKDFVQAETWMKGPNFLSKLENQWPQRQIK